MSLADDLKKQTDDFRTKKIDYQVDTLDVVVDKRFTLGYHNSGENTITLNYHENDEWCRDLEENDRDAILYHEQKHRSNHNKGFKADSIMVTPEQYYKLCMADEISAHMATLVYLREEYIKTKDINVFNKCNGIYSFYKEAVQKGEVNPFSSDSKDFEKDMSLIMNGTHKMWNDKFAELYARDHAEMACTYMLFGNEDFNDSSRAYGEYLKQLDIAFTIGGINFMQYNKQNLAMPIKTKDEAEELERESGEYLNDYRGGAFLSEFMNKIGRLREQTRDKVVNLSKKKEEKASEQKGISEVQCEEMLDLDKAVITGIPAAQRSQSTSSKNMSAEAPASTAQNVAVEKNNKDKAAYLRSLSGRTPQSPRARISPSFNQMRDNKNNMELMLLRRQMGR